MHDGDGDNVAGADGDNTASAVRDTAQSGGSIPGLARAAFTYQSGRRDDGAGGRGGLPLLIAVPHAGRAYPPAILDHMRDPGEAMVRLEDRHVDAIARRVADKTGAALLIAQAPRAIIDLNRDPGDIDPAMFRGDRTGMVAGARSLRGLGLFPRRLSGMGDIWRGSIPAHDAGRRIAAIHAPYHECLGRILADIQARFGEAVLLDLHSMPSLAPADDGGSVATHVVGTRFGRSCAGDFAAAALHTLERGGVEIAFNRPYAGGYVLDRHGDPRGGVHAIQLEIDRATYLGDDHALRDDGVEQQASLITDLIHALAAVARDRAARAQAAE
ncbi:N-formylglutamate amidohydrolase [Croceicoccus hydrothermalis]|uniref:N-formylglutamate amidohydrolase n=1 Tax=Croceicoccus hydrothermalis TaxID=2867964 RepID=UPI001EFA5B04|nr:N-formylglutamate amidohydrolase [Croceicoccus hydrothermalis]